MATMNAWGSQDPAEVAKGGTGASTLTGVLTGNGTSAVTANSVTQYGVVIGGASNAVGSTAVGTAAQVLTSNGAGVDPTFQAVPSVGSGGNPTEMDIFDDLVNTTIFFTKAGFPSVYEQSRLGTWEVLAGQGSYTYSDLLIIGGTEITLDAGFKLGSATVSATIQAIGFSDTVGHTNVAHNNKIWFSADTAATNWYMRCSNAGTTTSLDTSTAVDTNWHKFTLVINAAASSVEGFIDDVSIGTISTNIPSTSTNLRMYCGSWYPQVSARVDYFRYRQTRGT